VEVLLEELGEQPREPPAVPTAPREPR